MLEWWGFGIASYVELINNTALVSLAGAAASIIFVATKVLSWCVCRNKTHLWPQQKYACCDKTSVTTNTCLSQQRFCRDKHLSWQTLFYCDKSFVATRLLFVKHIFCHNKSILVATNICHINFFKSFSNSRKHKWKDKIPPNTSHFIQAECLSKLFLLGVSRDLIQTQYLMLWQESCCLCCCVTVQCGAVDQGRQLFVHVRV